MAVFKRGQGWRAQITMGKDPRTGKRTRLCWTFDTEAEAKAFERRKQEELRRLREQHVRPSTTRLDEYLPDWLRRKGNEGLAARTIADYRWCIDKLILPSLGSEPLADLSPSKVQQWQDALAPTRDTPGATTAARAFRVLRSALSDAERLGMIARNPAKAARPALRTRRKRDGFTLQEAQAIIAAAHGERLEPLFAFVLHSGLRVAEVLGLRWTDCSLDTDRPTLSVRQDMVAVPGRGMVAGPTKTGRSARTFVMLPHAAHDLKQQRAKQHKDRREAAERWQDTGLVFTAKEGGPLTTSNVDRAFRRVRELAGVRNLPLYSMRHAAASILLASGVAPAVAAKVMGHTLDMFFEVYADLLAEATAEAAEKAGAFLDAHPHKPLKAAGKGTVVPIRRPRKRQAAG